ncbi:MAG: tRNA(Ile)(2)-agmatinylcytidine synthase [Methanosphaera sp.]|nr:tRNA(Ile)(2)-agmatinylcytidine synthase [Methanosphaera sp.]
MCTTYLTYIILNELEENGIKPVDYPRLIRLNPFARYKTRGNGALSFIVELDNRSQVEQVEHIVLENTEKYAMLDGVNTNPGVVFYEGEITSQMREYAKNAIYNIYTIDYATDFAKKIGARIHKFKKGRGIIGSIAAISLELTDETFELLAYRTPENFGTKRQLDDESIFRMNDETYPETFENIDFEQNYAAIEPHTPCPVLYGIRGNTPDIVLKAHSIVNSLEPVAGFRVFRTNQHTDMHIQEGVKIANMRDTGCYMFECEVVEKPHDIEGGHVFFKVSDNTGILECAAFEPTKSFRNIIRKLVVGDKIVIYGGLNDNHTLNIEKIKVCQLATEYKYSNPICSCGKRMKSAGKNSGYKCPRCGRKDRDATKIKEELPRDLKPGFYEVPVEARRHLSKPIIRITTEADQRLKNMKS